MKPVFGLIYYNIYVWCIIIVHLYLHLFEGLTMTDTAETWTQRIAWTALIALIIGGITWAGWITIEINDRITYHDLENHAPYMKDKVWITREIHNIRNENTLLLEKIDTDLAGVLRNNTEAIIQLREQMRYTNKVLEKLTEKKENTP